ncbi:hypothetical protein SAMN05518672_1111 [Chitinophaga sp. CF118]|uniref:hypothetical protein n=1 Tax=Chitinophaga sp. CF118 TaxID=1884367 RepID=UPI0008F046AD|nr:hypothetical protein [Chitinophaga sp. CF118]SFE84231.1 hypothetical protein SAMN05518672_1111 [Chitinophaga sp. CF118]
MAILVDGIRFTGSVGNMSAYRIKGSDDIYVRMKGGGSKKKIKKSESCKPIRDNSSEFSIRSTAASNVRWMLTYVKHLADHKILSRLNSLNSTIQKYDTNNIKGQKEVLFSKYHNLLQGFSLNNRYPFDGIIRHPLLCTIDRNRHSAIVKLPDLIPQINLFLPWKSPMYRFIISLGELTDNARKPDPAITDKVVQVVYTDWQIAQLPYTGRQIELNLPGKPDETQTLVVSVGIEMGVPFTNDEISIVQNAGSAKILATG